MPEINVPLEDAMEKFKYYVDDIAKRQLPFACAKTLTFVARDIASDAVKLANLRFNVKHKTYLKNATQAKIGGEPSLSRAFNSVPADKKQGLEKMVSIVGVTHWGIADLVDGKMDVRGTKTAKYRWVPLKGRKLGHGIKTAYPGQGEYSKGNFFMRSKKGNYLLVTRAGKSRKITPMFLRKKKQDMRPIFSLGKISEKQFVKYWDKYFDENMNEALDTAR